MKELAQLLNEMLSVGVIQNYALFGAVAQMRYTEPVATMDADLLVAVPPQKGLDILSGVYGFCSTRGFQPEGEAIKVGIWPVQFIPVFSSLTQEAMEKAEVADFEGIPLRVVSACYLAVIALSVGRSKDFARVLALIESGSVTRKDISQLSERFGLLESWKKFESRFPSE
ncbi:MAG: hypothetical protein ACKVQC_09645 [Elusimicrobiota bacterium]